MKHRIFSYGTLRQPEVQQALYGRQVPTTEDSLPGYVIDWVTITAPDVIEKSGSDRHPILRPAQGQAPIQGSCLELSDAELAATDEYEVDDYVRVDVELGSGTRAWVYLAPQEA